MPTKFDTKDWELSVLVGYHLKDDVKLSAACPACGTGEPAMSVKEDKLTAERVRELLNYDPETGVFTWRVSRRATARPGSVAGTITPKGYRNIWIGGNYRAHRLAWLYVYGTWPTHEIDHIDGNRANNAIANLRDVTRSVNHENLRRARSDSAHGFLGVSPFFGKWKARITVNRKFQHLGVYDTPEEAHAAYLEAKRRLHVGCTI